MKIVLLGRPITKKNNMRIQKNRRTGQRFIAPSERFEQYQSDCLLQIPRKQRKRIAEPVNLKALYYMPTRGKVDLTNLLNATNDILVKAEVLKDDNSNIIKAHDGSRVLYDKNNPRVEIFIDNFNTL